MILSLLRAALLISIGATLVSGCGGRQANPVDEQTALDTRMGCEHIRGEYSVNQARIAELSQESGRGNDTNAALVAAVAVGGVANLMFLDLSDTMRRETDALQRRNQRLQGLASERSCGDL